jgi:hypothetical protein
MVRDADRCSAQPSLVITAKEEEKSLLVQQLTQRHAQRKAAKQALLHEGALGRLRWVFGGTNCS